MCEGAVKSIK